MAMSAAARPLRETASCWISLARAAMATKRTGNSRRLCLRKTHRDESGGSHGAGDPRRDVVDDVAIDEELAVSSHGGRERARDGHRGAHGLSEWTSVEDHGLAADEVRGHASERYGQLVETSLVRVGQGDATEQKADQVAGFEGARRVHATFEPELELGWIEPAVFLAPEGFLWEGSVAGKERVPVGLLQDRFDFVRRVAFGVGAPDQGPHARACDEVHRDAMLLEPPQHSDVGDTLGPAAGKREANQRPVGGCCRAEGAWGTGKSESERRQRPNEQGMTDRTGASCEAVERAKEESRSPAHRTRRPRQTPPLRVTMRYHATSG